MLNSEQTGMVIKVAGKALRRRFFTAHGAFRALEKAGYWGARGALAAIAQLRPILEETILHSKDYRLRERAIRIMEEVFFAQQKVVFDIQLPTIGDDVPEISWEHILRKTGTREAVPRFVNRSLVLEIDHDHLLVTKIMRPHDVLEDLSNEVKWMLYLKELSFQKRFVIPEPLAFKGSYLFNLTGLPIDRPSHVELHPKRHAICFTVHKDYFSYPNSSGTSERLSSEQIKEVMTRCAYLLGKLTSLGIIHRDIISLFHSRVQAQRRLDKGKYCWWQGHVGRLDRWLDSCDWPNLGLSGIRDFEHFSAFRGSLQGLFHEVGNHLLGLLLVTGSYFRNKDRTLVGCDRQRRPVDTWHLFDRGLLKQIVEGIISFYYEGLTGKRWPSEASLFDFESLIERMVEEMGTDNHMVEKLRRRDQQGMSPSAFRQILKRGGYCKAEIERFQQGAEDIDITTGPHLGEFNGEISLPEMVDLIRKAAVLFTIHRFIGSATSLRVRPARDEEERLNLRLFDRTLSTKYAAVYRPFHRGQRLLSDNRRKKS